VCFHRAKQFVQGKKSYLDVFFVFRSHFRVDIVLFLCGHASLLGFRLLPIEITPAVVAFPLAHLVVLELKNIAPDASGLASGAAAIGRVP
jgi:hypothetical protein